MRLYKRKQRTENETPQEETIRHQPSQSSISVTMPMYRLVRLRKLWLGSMFFLGMFSQFLLAIYTPSVWNYIYGVIQNFLPVL